MAKTRFGIMGCANIARKAFIPALQASDCAELVAVSSRSSNTAREFARTFCCEPAYGYESLLERDDIDAVYVATPNGEHGRWAIAAARAGKHVLCEKSLTTDAAQALQIVDVCRQQQVAVLEGFAYQFHPQHATLRGLVAQGSIGEPVLFQARFGFPPLPANNIRYRAELGGGALLDAGAYTVHAARQFFGREPISVHASLYNHGAEVDIHGSVLLDFGRGQTALLAFGFDNLYRNCYGIWGTKGQISLTRAFSIPPTMCPSLVLETQEHRETRELEHCDHFLAEITEFCNGLGSEKARNKWMKEAYGQAQVLDAIRNAEIL